MVKVELHRISDAAVVADTFQVGEPVVMQVHRAAPLLLRMPLTQGCTQFACKPSPPASATGSTVICKIRRAAAEVVPVVVCL
jgi:hypothetical protein